MFNIGDKVRLAGCPYDEQIPSELQKFADLEDVTQTVTAIRDVTHLSGTTGQWVKTDHEPDWIDKFWYRKQD